MVKVVGYFVLLAKPLNPVFTNKSGTFLAANAAAVYALECVAVPRAPTKANT